jgi:DNA primase
MSGFVDFAAVKQEVNILQVVTMLGLKMKGTNAQLRGACIACQSGGDRALTVNIEKGVFYCFNASAGGDLIALAAHVRGCSPRDAALAIAEQFGVGTGSSRNGASTSSPSPASQKEGFQALDYLEADHAAVEALGFDPVAATALGIGYAGKGLMRGLVAVPMRLPDGQLAGYIGITEAKLPNKWHGIPETNVVPIGKKTA